MKTFKYLGTLLLLAMAGACSNEDEIVKPESGQAASDGITFTAVFGVKNGTTRALNDPGDGTLTASWEVNEQIAIVFGGNKYAATVTEVDGEGNASVTATLPAGTPNNQAVTYIYPFTAADASGLRSDVLSSQDGTLATLSSEFDVATADGTLVVDGTTAQPNGTVTLVNQFAICKFQFTDETDRPIIIESVTITDLSTTEVITVTTPSAQPAVYVAMRPSQNSTKFEVVSNDGSSYTKTANARMEAGMFYRPTFKTVCVFDSKTVPLTFEAKVANSKVYFGTGSSFYQEPNLEYSKNGGEWTAYTLGAAITLENVGDKVAFRGDNASSDLTGYYTHFYIYPGECYVYGNIMSLLYTTELPTRTTLSRATIFKGLFSDSQYGERLYSHPTQKLLLPATTLASGCYQEMFYGCYNLTTAPVMNATTLAQNCCKEMFANCFNLTTAPDLPATTLASGCYQGMFSDCYNLTTAPALPATTLATDCYTRMFCGCTSLTTAPELRAETLAGSCYEGMFSGCTSLTTAPELPATTLADDCYAEMFSGCTSLTTAPVLRATTLAPYCYCGMFLDCSNLNRVKCLATSMSANNCTTEWLSGVASSGTFTKAAGVTWSTGESGIPENWTVVEE
ncbi:MAG: leucine-rich repeat protein [Bacteroidaceae bacterium]|nr:leucine-rich repeat protein [Bacteroidaceae bacterium]